MVGGRDRIYGPERGRGDRRGSRESDDDCAPVCGVVGPGRVACVGHAGLRQGRDRDRGRRGGGSFRGSEKRQRVSGRGAGRFDPGAVGGRFDAVSERLGGGDAVFGGGQWRGDCGGVGGHAALAAVGARQPPVCAGGRGDADAVARGGGSLGRRRRRDGRGVGVGRRSRMDAAVGPVGGGAGPDAGGSCGRCEGMGRFGFGAAVAGGRWSGSVVRTRAAVGGFGERSRSFVGGRRGGAGVPGRRRGPAASGHGTRLRVRGSGRCADALWRLWLRARRRAALPAGDAARPRQRDGSGPRSPTRRRPPRHRSRHRSPTEHQVVRAPGWRAAPLVRRGGRLCATPPVDYECYEGTVHGFPGMGKALPHAERAIERVCAAFA